MASSEDLPDQFDVIVLGTGLPESIVAAACSRIGLNVLHLDRNEYYGGPWSSFNLEGWQKWVESVDKLEDGENAVPDEKEIRQRAQLRDGERLLFRESKSPPFRNVSSDWLIPEKNDEIADDKSDGADNADDEINEQSPSAEENNDSSLAESESEQNSKEAEPSGAEAETDQSAQSKEWSDWTRQKVMKDWRRFSLDLTPKILCGRGKMVQLLISSGVSRYAEFKCVDRILTRIGGQYMQVPCSRSDVFQASNIPVIEKRRLMKLLTLALNYQTETQEYADFQEKPFDEFLAARDLSEEVRHYIRCAIAMVPKSASTIKGLESTHKFLMSVGKFGNSPFLWTLYGSGELPQCFCRLCAVFGGIYCLRRPVDAWIMNADKEYIGIVSGGQRISCRYMVADMSYLPDEMLLDGSRMSGSAQYDLIHRMVLVTNSSLKQDSKEHVTLLNVDTEHGSIRIIEVGPGALVCPADLYVVHLTSSDCEMEQMDLLVRQFFDLSKQQESDEPCEKNKAKVLWKSAFSYTRAPLDPEYAVTSNLALVSWPDSAYDYESAVNELYDDIICESSHRKDDSPDLCPRNFETLIDSGKVSNTDYEYTFRSEILAKFPNLNRFEFSFGSIPDNSNFQLDVNEENFVRLRNRFLRNVGEGKNRGHLNLIGTFEKNSVSAAKLAEIVEDFNANSTNSEPGHFSNMHLYSFTVLQKIDMENLLKSELVENVFVAAKGGGSVALNIRYC